MSVSSVRRSSDLTGVVAVLGLVLVGLAVRSAAWWVTWPTPVFNDEVFYYFGPLQWVQGTQPLDSTRPPAMMLLNAAVMKGVGVAPGTVRGAGVLLGSLVVLLVYLIAHRVGGRRSALTAAAITAVYPPLVAFSHYLYSETLFMVFALLAVWLSMRQERRLSPIEVAIAGLACGMAALTRDVGVVLTGGLAFAIAWLGAAGLRRRVASACAMVLLAALIVAPWSVHLYRATGDFGLVSRTTWMNLYLGNPAPGKRASMAQYLAFGDSLNERAPVARRRALSAIRERMPMWPIEKLKVLLPLFRPTSFPVKRLLAAPGQPRGEVGRWRYKFTWSALDTPLVRWILASIAATSYVAVALFGFGGLILSRPRNSSIVLWIFVASIVMPVLLTFPNTRFRLPVEPILIVGAAIAAGEGKQLWREASPVRRIAAAASVAGMACLLLLEADAFLSATKF